MELCFSSRTENCTWSQSRSCAKVWIFCLSCSSVKLGSNLGAAFSSLIRLFKQITDSKRNILLKQFIYSTEDVLVDLQLDAFAVQHLPLITARLPHSLHVLAHHRHRPLHVPVLLPLRAHEQRVVHGRLLVGVVHHARRGPVLRHERQGHLRLSPASRAHVEVLRQQHHHVREVAQRGVGLAVLRLGDLAGGYGGGRGDAPTSQRHLGQAGRLDGPLGAALVQREQERHHRQQARAARVQALLDGRILLPSPHPRAAPLLQRQLLRVLRARRLVVVRHRLRLTAPPRAHLAVLLQRHAQPRQLLLHLRHRRLLCASARAHALTRVQLLAQRGLLLLQLLDVVVQALGATPHAAAPRPRHLLLVLLQRPAHGVLHHLLHQRHAVVVALRARLLQVQLLQRRQDEVEVALRLTPPPRRHRVAALRRRLDLRRLDLLQHARTAEEGAHLVRGKEAVRHAEQYRVERQRLAVRRGEERHVEDLLDGTGAHVVLDQLLLLLRDGVDIDHGADIDGLQGSEIIELLDRNDRFDDELVLHLLLVPDTQCEHYASRSSRYATLLFLRLLGNVQGVSELVPLRIHRVFHRFGCVHQFLPSILCSIVSGEFYEDQRAGEGGY